MRNQERNKQGCHSVNPSVSNIVSTTNTRTNLKDIDTSESIIFDQTFPKGNESSQVSLTTKLNHPNQVKHY